MAARDSPHSLLSFARRYGNIPEDGRGTPWFDDGNIFLFTNDKAFKFYMGFLRAPDTAPWFDERLQDLSDDSVDVICDHPAIPVDDSAEDLAYFLIALTKGCGRAFPLETNYDFMALSAILRLSTKYRSKRLRENAIHALQQKFPSTFAAWDSLAEKAVFRQWTCEPIPVINLARQVAAVSLLPAAMASLSNDASAGEVFGVRVHDGTRQRRSPHELESCEDIIGFTLMKEYNHVSITKLIDFVREVGRDCIQPPEPEPRPNGMMSPVGTRRAQPQASICSNAFHRLADVLTVKLKREDPIGYREFTLMVREDGISQKLSICQRCRLTLKNGYESHRENWWKGIPHILGLPEVRDAHNWDPDHSLMD